MVRARLSVQGKKQQDSGSMELVPYDPAIPLLVIYSERTTILKDMCTPMFIASIFTIARTWKQPRCVSTYEWIEKLWYI